MKPVERIMATGVSTQTAMEMERQFSSDPETVVTPAQYQALVARVEALEQAQSQMLARDV